jgi:hypothetical protein
MEVKEPDAIDSSADAGQLAPTKSLTEAKGTRDSLPNTFGFFWAGGSRSQKPATVPNSTKADAAEDLKKDP